MVKKLKNKPRKLGAMSDKEATLLWQRLIQAENNITSLSETIQAIQDLQKRVFELEASRKNQTSKKPSFWFKT